MIGLSGSYRIPVDQVRRAAAERQDLRLEFFSRKGGFELRKQERIADLPEPVDQLSSAVAQDADIDRRMPPEPFEHGDQQQLRAAQRGVVRNK